MVKLPSIEGALPPHCTQTPSLGHGRQDLRVQYRTLPVGAAHRAEGAAPRTPSAGSIQSRPQRHPRESSQLQNF